MKKVSKFFMLFAVVFGMAFMVPAANAGDVEVGGFASIKYQEGNDANDNLGHDASTFAVDEVEVTFSKELAEGVNLVVETQFLGTANVMNAVDANGDGAAAFGVEQAYVTIPAGPVGLTVGLFNIPIGLDGADKTDLNTATHSLIFDNAVPTSGAGVMASIAPEGSPVNVDLYVLNGWDDKNAGDNNSAKTIGTRIGVNQGPVNFGLSYITGRENHAADDLHVVLEIDGMPWTIAGIPYLDISEYNDSETTVIDVDLTVDAGPVEFGFEYNMGTISEVGKPFAVVNKNEDAEWSAWTVQATAKFNETCGLTVRLEEFDDEDAFIFGLSNKKVNGGATVEALTVALKHKIADGAKVVLEWKESELDTNKNFNGPFLVGGKASNSAELITAEFVYEF